MKKLWFISVVLVLSLLGAIGWSLFNIPQEVSLAVFINQKLPELVATNQKKSEVDFTQTFLANRPPELVNVDLQLPHYQDYSVNELRSLYDYSRKCTNEPSNASLSSELQKLLVWLKFVCHRGKIPSNFFRKAPYLVPSGSSYVSLAEELNFDFNNHLSQEEIAKFKSISEMTPDLNLQQLQGLLAYENILVGRKSIYVKQNSAIEGKTEIIYYKISKGEWQKIIGEQNYDFAETKTSDCLQPTINGCWRLNPESERTRQNLRYFVGAVSFLLIFLIIGFVGLDRWRRAQQKQKQKFALQMLTHELRTPVTTLALLIENLRSDFNSLSIEQQKHFLNMTSEVSRLKQTVQMSYAYLQTDKLTNDAVSIQLKKIEINSFLAEYIDSTKFSGVEFLPHSESVFIEAEPYWLSLCLDNLLRNAFDHGQPPVRLICKTDGKWAKLIVEDQGQIQNLNLDQMLQPFFKGTRSYGFGLGLSIIHQVMIEMKGRLELEHSPSRFILSWQGLS